MDNSGKPQYLCCVFLDIPFKPLEPNAFKFSRVMYRLGHYLEEANQNQNQWFSFDF